MFAHQLEQNFDSCLFACHDDFTQAESESESETLIQAILTNPIQDWVGTEYKMTDFITIRDAYNLIVALESIDNYNDKIWQVLTKKEQKRLYDLIDIINNEFHNVIDLIHHYGLQHIGNMIYNDDLIVQG